ncbi:SPOR domain-containing protein [Propionivibrio dicarboxylicus]|uniref:Sporulation related domain-containing protein n=1 Tax=Propionivibrio dicarboxylicus TaxID=83767 RepID=A0A1G7WBQ4_9RHOO|nr:SPOR domain-containing protein [Propionivibrio dicarboxylicus]SDG69427.1 Sporulation related domain-containing protein [Propionivibrio dicarboxylicus]
MKAHTRSSRSPNRTSGGNTLLGLFVGLVIGVLTAAGVVWYIFKTPAPFSNKYQAPATASAANPAAPPAAGGSVPAQVPMALPGKPGDPIPQAGDKPRFDFYKILPGNADAVPDPKAAAKTPDGKTRNEKDALLAEPVYLQTGSYQNAGDADNQKARLAMMGAEATIHQVMLQDKVWYRVRLGPFRKMDEVTSLRSELAKQGIEANVVKKD